MVVKWFRVDVEQCCIYRIDGDESRQQTRVMMDALKAMALF